MVDYGAGNLFSIETALRRIGLDVEVTSAPRLLRGSDAIVLPGVGNFTVGSKNLEPAASTIAELVGSGVPLLGICLGLQLLLDASEEGVGEGLGLVRGRVLRLPGHVKIPHMGWNTLRASRPCDLLDGVEDGDFFYFAHSYYPEPADGRLVAAETEHGVAFPSVLAGGGVYGTQFHPEKSGPKGERILRNFVRIVAR